MVLVVGGAIITGEIVPHSSIMRDLVIGLGYSEEFALKTAQQESEKEELLSDTLSMSNVSIHTGSYQSKAPFLRVRLSAIDAWYSGVVTQIERL